MPKSRIEFWAGKFQRNVERDSLKQAQLEDLGWRVATIWECEARNGPVLDARLTEILNRDGAGNG